MSTKDELCGKVVKLAADILKSEGPEALTVRRIAHDSGASTQLIYTLFGGKFGLIDCLYRQGFHLLRDHLAACYVPENPRATLEAMIRGYRDFAFKNPAFFTIMYTRPVPEYKPPEESTQEAWKTFELILPIVEQCQKQGMVAGDPAYLVRKIWSQVHGIVSLEIIGHLWENAPEQILNDLIANLWIKVPSKDSATQ
jgi:AcrR family transcriptional regulator